MNDNLMAHMGKTRGENKETKYPDANVMLMAIIKPMGNAADMLAAIVGESEKNRTYPYTEESTDQVYDVYLREVVGYENKCYTLLMSTAYNEEFEVTGEPGTVIAFDYLTMGSGKKISWIYAEKEKNTLEAWAKGVCERHGGEFNIVLTANYWG